MYPLSVIQSDKYQTSTQPKSNFTRDSSFHFSRAGVVIHSGEHRSTAFIPADTDLHSHFRYWIKQEQEAVNGFIVACVEGLGDEQCHENACRVSRKGWNFEQRKGKLGGGEIIASRKNGKLRESFSSYNWRAIHFLTK